MNAQEKIDQLMKAEMEHIRSVGGILNLPEADSVLNDLNREKLKALKELHGHLYLGRINIHDTAQRLRVVEGTEGARSQVAAGNIAETEGAGRIAAVLAVAWSGPMVDPAGGRRRPRPSGGRCAARCAARHLRSWRAAADHFA